MKNIINISFLLLTFLSISCSSTYSFQQFYNSHKNDMNSTAFQMPKFLTNILSGMSPEMNGLFRNVDDFRHITIENLDQNNTEKINTEINLITNKSFSDIIRKNQENSRLIISTKENEGIVKELVYYKLENNKINAFYLKGNFNSNNIKKLSERGDFEDFTTKLLLQPTNRIIPNSIQ